MGTSDRSLSAEESIAFLTQCADREGKHYFRGVETDPQTCPTCRGTNQAGWLRVPASRYGRTSAEVAPVAYATAVVIAGETGTLVDEDLLDSMMGLVVNDHDDPEDLLRDYGGLYGFSPEDLYGFDPED